jgi:hypothetical protein
MRIIIVIILAAVAATAIGLAGLSGVAAFPINATTVGAAADTNSLMRIGYYYYKNGHRYYYSGPGRRSCPDWKRDSGLC